jgi:hypothetical protein
MFEFLSTYWNEMPSATVADVLSESNPAYGGISSDPGAWHTWQQAVRLVRDKQGGTGIPGPSSDQASQKDDRD